MPEIRGAPTCTPPGCIYSVFHTSKAKVFDVILNRHKGGRRKKKQKKSSAKYDEAKVCENDLSIGQSYFLWFDSQTQENTKTGSFRQSSQQGTSTPFTSDDEVAPEIPNTEEVLLTASRASSCLSDGPKTEWTRPCFLTTTSETKTHYSDASTVLVHETNLPSRTLVKTALHKFELGVNERAAAASMSAIPLTEDEYTWILCGRNDVCYYFDEEDGDIDYWDDCV